MFTKNTVEDLIQHCEANTEIIVVLDGEWANPPISQHEMVNIIYVPTSIGQRAATNLGVRLSRAKYVAKVDAHCSFDQGFDRIMLEAFKEKGDDVTMVPIMRNLWAFDWKCRRCKWIRYQGPTPLKCEKCGDSRYIIRKMRWIGKHNPQSTSYCFDSEPHFQYFEDWKHRPGYKEAKAAGFTESMSLQGSFFMCTREKYWELDLGGEGLGNWGNQGLQVACDTWLSGGKVLCCHRTWYAHMFRTQGGDFSFPYPQSGREVQKTKNKVKEEIWHKKRPKQIYPVSWLVKRFWPVPGWTEKNLQDLELIESNIENDKLA
jgi:hypothetical protein